MAEICFTGFTCEHLEECHPARGVLMETEMVVDLVVDENVKTPAVLGREFRERRVEERRVKALEIGMIGRCVS